MFFRLLSRPLTIQNLQQVKLDKSVIKYTTVSKLFSGCNEKSTQTPSTTGLTTRGRLPLTINDNIRSASTFSLSKMVTQIGTNSRNILIGVDFNELKKAPPAAFWITTAGGALFMAPPLLEILFGYSSFLTTVETGIGVAFLSMLGTMKWGHCLERKGVDGPTWDNMTWSMVPAGVAVVSFMLPEALALLVLSGGICHAVYMDVSSYTYPPWANALGCYISTIAVAALFLTFLGRVIFG